MRAQINANANTQIVRRLELVGDGYQARPSLMQAEAQDLALRMESAERNGLRVSRETAASFVRIAAALERMSQ